MAKHTVKYGVNSLVIVISFALILIVVNYLSSKHFARVDVTSDKAYTITDATKKILGKLPEKDNVLVKIYITEQLPPNLINTKRDIMDILEEYNVYSKGKLKIEFIDPGNDEGKEQEFAMKGIRKIPVMIIEKEKQESREIYLSMEINYQDKKEIIPMINVQTLEYDLTSSIVKVTTDPKKVGIFFKKSDETQEKQFKENYMVLQELISKNYQLVEVTKDSIEQSLKDINTLIMIGPDNLSERELYLVDQFVMRGGKLIALVDTVKFPEKSMMPEKNPTNVAALLESYGIKINDDIVYDLERNAVSMAAFNMGNMMMQMPYPFYIKILPEGYDTKQPIVSRLTNVVMPWASSVTIKEGLPADITKSELIKTSPLGDHQVDNFDINPQQKFKPKGKEEMKSFALAGVLTGKFNSYYKGKEAPAAEAPAEGQQQAPPPDNTPKIDQSTNPSQIIVVGNSRFAEDRRCFQQSWGGVQMADNGRFLLNSIDWMTMGDDLINVRTREVSDRPLKNNMSDSAVNFYKFFGTFGIAILVVILGIARMFIKKAKRASLAGVYSSK